MQSRGEIIEKMDKIQNNLTWHIFLIGMPVRNWHKVFGVPIAIGIFDRNTLRP
jgi:hypothetical protein